MAIKVSVSLRLQYGFFALVKAVCAYMMSRFASLHTWLYRVGKSSSNDFHKLIALRLTFPVAQLCYFFFEIAYSCGQRRLLLIGDKDGAMSFYQLNVHLRYLRRDLVEIAQLSGGFKKFCKLLYACACGKYF